jgi:hypothetical protein
MTGLDNMTKADHAPSDTEKQEIVAATARHRERAPRVAINIRQPENATVKISPTHWDGQGWDARLKDALGTTSPAFVDRELVQLLNVFCDRAGTLNEAAVNAALAVVDGLKPLKFSARLYNGALETIPQQDSAALTLSRLQRAFTTQMDSLSNMRRGGRAKSGGRTCPRLPGRTSDRRQCDPSREGGIR